MRLLKWFQSATIASLCLGTATAQNVTTVAAPNDGTAPQPTYASTANTGPVGIIPNSAATYATYQGDLAQVRSEPLSSQSQIEQKLDALGGHNLQKFTSGWMSYSALVAAQNREFAASVRDIEDAYGRDRLVNALRKAPSYVATLKGGDRALQSALAAAEADAMFISSTASILESQEGQLQNQSWINERIRDGAERASRLRSLAEQGRPATSAARNLFASANLDSLLSQSNNPGAWDRATRIATNAPLSAISSLTQRHYSVNPSRTETANHMATLAAYEIIGNVSTSDPGVVKAMSDRKAKNCFQMAQVQLNGCVRGQSSHYGLQACMRKHAISDIGDCVGEVAQ